MKKIFVATLVVVALAAGGYYFSSVSPAPSPSLNSLSPIFAKLASWEAGATWGTPQRTTESTPYGDLKGTLMEGKISGKDASISRNFEDETFMQNLGFVEDISFAADGPGASNWGYIKTEKGKSQVAIFRYSTERLLGPESNVAPFTNLSVFVSDEFVKN